MPKLHLYIHVDQNGQQTINSDGDPSLWPLVGRLAACHPQASIVRIGAHSDLHEAYPHPITERYVPANYQFLKERSAEVEHLKEQMDLIDAILRPVVAADDGDSCTDLAGLARGELVAVREELQATRAVLEEAIGRTPDPARSTKQLALDLAEVLKAAVAAR